MYYEKKIEGKNWSATDSANVSKVRVGMLFCNYISDQQGTNRRKLIVTYKSMQLDSCKLETNLHCHSSSDIAMPRWSVRGSVELARLHDNTF